MPVRSGRYYPSRGDIVCGLARAVRARKIVEVGLDRCATVRHLLHELSGVPGLQYWGVDPFQPTGIPGYVYSSRSVSEWEELRQKAIELEFRYCGIFRLILTPSPEAARSFNDAAVDLVFLDADHKEEAVYSDIVAWMPKIRAGGILCGHDYLSTRHTGVRRALARALPEGVKAIHDVWVKKVER